jgi:hypothetical protein
LLDRAEEIFDKLRESELAEDAKRNLLEIYQLEKDWEKAIVDRIGTAGFRVAQGNRRVPLRTGRRRDDPLASRSRGELTCRPRFEPQPEVRSGQPAPAG